MAENNKTRFFYVLYSDKTRVFDQSERAYYTIYIIINNYYMANPVLGKSLCSDWFFLGQDFAVRTVSMETVQPLYFCFGPKPANSKFATKTAKKNCEYCHSSQ